MTGALWVKDGARFWDYFGRKHPILYKKDTRLTSSRQAQVIKKKIGIKLKIFSSASILTFVLDAQKNRLIETVLLSTHNICFG